MTVAEDTLGRIKVIMNSDDLKELGLDYGELNCSNPETRLLLRAVFKLAACRIGKDYNTSQLLIEAYPHPHGGCVLYFTPLKNRPKKRLRIKEKATPIHKEHCYFFADGDEFLRAVDILYANPFTRNLKSLAYSTETAFVLIIISACELPVMQEIKEFSQLFLQGEHIKRYTCEHGKLLAGENAIANIGQRISPNF